MGGRVLTEEEEPPERSSKNREEKLEDLTVRNIEEDTLEEGIIFQEVEEEA
jgi:hypothetical protein